MIMYLSPVTVFWNQIDFSATSARSWASPSGVAPFFFRSATVVPGVALFRASALGVYQMGEVQARSWIVAATTSGGGMWSWCAWIVVQRGVGISSTRA